MLWVILLALKLASKTVVVIWDLLSSCLWKTDSSTMCELVLFPGELNCIYHTISLKCTVLLVFVSLDCILNTLQSFPLSTSAIPELIFQNQQLCKFFSVFSVWMKMSLSPSKSFICLHKESIVKGHGEWYATHTALNSQQAPLNYPRWDQARHLV